MFRSCSVRVRAAQEHRLDGVLLGPGPQVGQEQPHCGEEPLDADLHHRERSNREATTGLQRSGLGWDGRPTHRFLKKKNRRKVGRSSMANVERGLWEGENFKEVPQFLESNRISPTYGLTSSIDQTSIIEVSLFSCYIQERADFVPF